MNFGEAIEAIKEGQAVARSGWNGKGMFVFMRPADAIPVDVVIHNIKSLPQVVKDYFVAQFAHTKEEEQKGKNLISFTPYLCMKAADNSIVNGWLASQTDMLATDWELFKITND